MDPYPISQVRDVLIYLDAIVLNNICTIGQALFSFDKPGIYIEWAIRSNRLGYGLSYVISGIKYRKVIFFDEKENLCFDTRIIIIIFYLIIILTSTLNTCKFVY